MFPATPSLPPARFGPKLPTGMAQILIDCPDSRVRPGGVIAGEALWDLEEDPGSITLSIGWWTEGKGARDERIIEAKEIKNAGRIGKDAFRFEVPTGPLSFSGKLISLNWAIEAGAVKGNAKAVHRFTVSIGDHEIDISGQSYESKGKSVSFRPG